MLFFKYDIQQKGLPRMGNIQTPPIISLSTALLNLNGMNYNYIHYFIQNQGMMYQGQYKPLQHRYNTDDKNSQYKLHDFQGTIQSQILDYDLNMDMNIRSIYDCDKYWKQQYQIKKKNPNAHNQPLSVIFYFYADLNSENIVIKQFEQNLIQVTFLREMKSILVSVKSDDKVIIRSQSFQYDQTQLWKTHHIYTHYAQKEYSPDYGNIIISTIILYIDIYLLRQLQDQVVNNIGFVQIILFSADSLINVEYGRDENQWDFEHEFMQRKQIFEKKVISLFWPNNFDKINKKLQNFEQDQEKNTQGFKECLQTTISNILGGILMYHGTLIRSDDQIDDYKAVFAASPSRTRFPRAFLWDDGFHLVPICKWDKYLCKKIIVQWFILMDQNGWIAREQARGEEIKSEIPYQFLSQDPMEANPPTLLLPIRYILKQILQQSRRLANVQQQYIELSQYIKNLTQFRIQKQMLDQQGLLYDQMRLLHFAYTIDVEFLKQINPYLQKWRQWFTNTQTHDDNQRKKYRWKCKGSCDSGQFYGSGMDDYPRMKPSALLQEHIDLKCWILFFDQTLAEINNILYQLEQNNFEKEQYQMNTQNYILSLNQHNQDLDTYFLDRSDNLYKDYGIQIEPENQCVNKFTSYIYSNDKYNGSNIFIHEPGYVTLFPMFFGSIKQNTIQQKQIIRFILNHNIIWSDYGLRSLSLNSKYFGTGDDYWRGSIWMPINYLALRGLKMYLNSDVAYNQLRINLLVNLYKNWKQDGFMFENYNSITGKGQRGYPFDGWTGAMFLAISGEIYD